MKTYLFYLAALIWWQGNLLSQNSSIKATILDEEHQPVPYVTVFLKHAQDSTLYKGEMTNEAGEINFQNIKSGSFYIQISYLGYQTLKKSDLFVPDSATQIHLGEIILEKQSQQLEGVVVQAEKPFIEKQADKTVVNIENSIIQTGSSIMEVLEKLPGVMVDQDGNVRMRGKQGVRILIDGKPSTLSGQDLVSMLKGLTSSNIQKIELITNPSAKWDASGNAGIINIITKKNKRDGFNGHVNLSYGQGRYSKYNTSFSLNYKKNKFNFFCNYSYANRKAFNHLMIDRKFYNQDTLKTTFITDNYMVFPFNTHSGRLGADYFISPKTSISVLASGVSNDFNPTTISHSDIYGSGNEKVSSYNFTENSIDKFYNSELNTQIQHKFDSTGQELNINLDYGRYWSNTHQLFTTINKDESSNIYSTSYLVSQQIGALNLYSFKADYSKPLKHDIVFESGIKSSLVESDRNMEFYNRINNMDIFDSARSSHFIYKENINAGYLNLLKKFKKVDIQAGLRAEQTLAHGVQKLNGKNFNRNYLQVFPTLYIDYHINEQHNLNVNLGRRIDRPHYEQMNPFKRLIDATTYSEGNPYLLPQLTYNSELSYSYKNTFFINLNYSYTYNNITDVLVQDAATKTTNQTVVNLNTLNYFSIDISYSKRLTKWWKTNTNILSYYPMFKGSINNYYINQGKPSFYINSGNNFSITDGLSAECNFQYNHQNLYGVTLDRTTYNLSVGIQKSILKKQGTITVNLTDIFWKAYPWGITNFGNVTEHWIAKRDTRVLTIAFSYKFGKGQTKIRRNTGADTEKSRMQ